MKKKGTTPFHPPLVVLLPVMALLAANIGMAPLNQAFRPVFVALGVSALLWALFGLIFKSVEKGAMGATAFILVTFIFGYLLRQFNQAFDGPWLIALWGVAAGGAAVLASLKCPWTKPLNVLAAMTFLVALFQAVTGYVQARGSRPASDSDSPVAVSGPRPDIYYLILDGHGSDRSIERVFGVPAEQSLGHRLEKLGFFVADKSRSNYMQTELSLGSSMNMDYLQKLLPDADPESDNRRPFKDLTNNSRLGEMLKNRGYEMIALRSASFPPVAFEQADFAISEDRGMTFIEGTLLELTPFGRSPIVGESQYLVHREETLGTLQNLRKLAGKAAKPRFIIAHILCPHPPFVFDQNGEPRRQPGPFGLWDGPDYLHYVGQREDYKTGYRDQVQYLDKIVADTAHAIQSAPGDDPIIIIQGDHGSKLGLNGESASKTDLDEVFSILNAYYVPPSIRARLRPDTAPVNSWRLVLSTLFGDDLPELPAESYWSPYGRPMKLDRVTDQLKARSSD